MFDIGRCAIPEIWCGNKNTVPVRKDTTNKKYYKIGTRTECLKKGFGAGWYAKNKETLPSASLQNIKYIGAIHEEKFAASGIRTLSKLKTEMAKKTPEGIKIFLTRVLIKKDGVLDKRAYNSVVAYLYHSGNPKMPQCFKL